MGSLRELTNTDINVHMLYSDSSKADMYVYDTLKKVYGTGLESIFEVNSKSSFNEMLDLSIMTPFISDKWLFVVDYSKLKGISKKFKTVFNSESSVFFIRVSSYKDYKEFKSLVPKLNDIYLSFIRAKDVMFLLSEFNLSQKLVDFIISSYASDVEKIFDLRDELLNGTKIEKPKEITQLIGVSGGSVSKFALQLLYEFPTTEKGLKAVYRNRVRDVRLLVDTYGVTSTRNFLMASVKDILDIKTLYTQGIIFKRITDIPDKYDEKRLSRYSYCLERIENEIPYNRILRLYCMLKNSYWKKEQDMLEFIYSYYGGL